jgi:hypothetical protein
MKFFAVVAKTCWQAVLKNLSAIDVKVLLVAIRDFFVCGVALFFDDSEVGYELFFKIP